MRSVLDGIKKSPHPEEVAERPSRRAPGADPAVLSTWVQGLLVGNDQIIDRAIRPDAIRHSASAPATPNIADC